jgi:3-methyladenine DNA glycosylase AlkD
MNDSAAKADARMLRRIAEDLEKASDPDYRRQIERLVPGVRTRGVRVPAIRALAAAFDKEHRPDFDARVALTGRLFATRSRDEALFGVFVLARARRHLPMIPWPTLAGWVETVDNWETCDQLAMNVAAPLVAAQAELVPSLIKLTSARGPWQRRFALATAAALNQGKRALPAATIAVCTRLLRDEEPMVRKALGWALREACKHDADGVFRLLQKHRSEIARSVLREASKKLTAAQKKELLLTRAASR